METRESLSKEPQAQLLGLLTGALLGAPSRIKELHGCAPLETETIQTDFVPSDRKIVLTYVGDPEVTPTLYYTKTDAHDPNPFQMPDGKLKVGETFNVTRIRRTENGLVFGTDYQDRGNNYFYTNSLDNLTVEIVEKTNTEKAQDQLNELGGDADQYDYFVLMAHRYRKAAERLLEGIERLPVFDINSPSRYCIDTTLAGSLYRFHDGETPELISQWSGLDGRALASKFVGSRIAVVNDKVLLIDDETKLAMGTVVNEGRYGAFGFSNLRVENMNINDTQRDHNNSELLQKLPSR